MNAVDQLAALLAPAARLGAVAMPASRDLDAVIDTLTARLKAGSVPHAPEDTQLQALQRFWQDPSFETLHDARVVAFGIGVALDPAGARMLDDTRRFDAVLSGIDRWLDSPRWYRRCYQGLLWSYFNVDPLAEGMSKTAQQHWRALRDYLKRRAPRTRDPQLNPAWVDALLANAHLLGDDPGRPWVAGLMQGDRRALDDLCDRLDIGGSSWLIRHLVTAQISAAVQLDDAAFVAQLSRLVGLLGEHAPLRDDGLTALLERQARSVEAVVHAGLRDAVAMAWGVPWQPENALHWQRLGENTRAQVAEWIKVERIESFFDNAEDHHDRRRARFWQRYAKSIRSIALPRLDGSPGDKVMVMIIGCAQVVAFGDLAEPVRVHDLREPQPFDLGLPLSIEPGAPNSLRPGREALLLVHRDGIGGWRQWEQMFEAALKERFDLRPGVANGGGLQAGFVDLSDASAAAVAPLNDRALERQRLSFVPAGEDVHWQTAEAASVPYSRPDLEVFARVHALRLVDRTPQGEGLWVCTDAADARIARVLHAWGFSHFAGAGWRR
jgi:hypothetical protein